ncbi:ArsR/SmtB family transcription factor [Brucella pseudogrignonensis]|uniref:ArsR/SmtB family transcription factor n=1 Tax=Brucella pseudogrignonensis TaxID=419475 RepID=UPI0038D1A290
MALKSLVDDTKTIDEISDALQGLANVRRLSILSHLLDCEMNVGDLAKKLKMSPSALSQHLAKLKEAGFVTVRAEGTNRVYAANNHAIAYFETRLRLLLVN